VDANKSCGKVIFTMVRTKRNKTREGSRGLENRKTHHHGRPTVAASPVGFYVMDPVPDCLELI